MNAVIEPLEPRRLGMPAAEVWIELRAAQGHTLAVLRLQTLPVTCGRGLANTIILEQPGVEETHVRIGRTQEGTLFVQPVVPATMLVDGGPRTRYQHCFDYWTLVQLGSATLRVVDLRATAGEHRIESHGSNSWTPWLARWRHVGLQGLLGAALLACGLAGKALADWLADTRGRAFTQFLTNHWDYVPWIAAWLVAWSALSRWLSGHWCIHRHARVLALGLVTYAAAKIILPLATSALHGVLAAPIAATGWIGLASLTACMHLQITPLSRSRQRWGIGLSLGLGALVVAVAGYSSFESHRDAETLPEELPVGRSLTRHEPRQAAMAAIDSLKVAVDKARAAPRRP